MHDKRETSNKAYIQSYQTNSPGIETHIGVLDLYYSPPSTTHLIQLVRADVRAPREAKVYQHPLPEEVLVCNGLACAAHEGAC